MSTKISVTINVELFLPDDAGHIIAAIASLMMEEDICIIDKKTIVNRIKLEIERQGRDLYDFPEYWSIEDNYMYKDALIKAEEFYNSTAKKWFE
jgi:hypothetical protein